MILSGWGQNDCDLLLYYFRGGKFIVACYIQQLKHAFENFGRIHCRLPSPQKLSLLTNLYVLARAFLQLQVIHL